MLTARAAASLLADSRSLDGLIALARVAGCAGTSDILDAEARGTLGLGVDVLDAALVAGPGDLRALVLSARSDVSLRELISRLAARVSARTPHALWLLVVGQPAGNGIAVAAWPGGIRGRSPRVTALIADRTAIIDSDVDTVRALAAAGADDDLTTHARWIEILGREALSRRFFRTLERLVGELADSTQVGSGDARREIALLYTSRLLFLAFVEAKGWLDGDGGFLARRFDDCMRSGGGFHRRVLLPLFFGTLNTPTAQRARVARAFGRVPFLNGGLSTPTSIERQLRPLRFDDAALGSLFADLLGRYRFTAREESMTFQEAAIDPEMLGRTFESLMVHRSRRASGAFYTPHELVDRVTTSGLHDALSASLGEALAERVMRGGDAGTLIDLSDDERRRAREVVSHLTILDPACGSGAFLVHVLERIASLSRELGDRRSPDVIRRQTLTRQIFGVDVNPTAVWLCELRLWLAVVIETPDDVGHLVAPLPNLDRNIRVGDSLAGAAFSSSGFADPGYAVAGGAPLRRLRERYSRATGARKHSLARALDRAERLLVVATLDSQLRMVTHMRRELIIVRRGHDLFGERNIAGHETLRRATDLRQRSARLRAARTRILAGGALGFSFPAHFADIAGTGGFALIVGNPPWVRPHRLPPADREAYRRAYRVARSAPWSGGAIAAGAGHGFAAQVDLAALFAERSLHLLRPGGTMALLLPAKLWRSLSGGGLRQLLLNDARLQRVDDYSDALAAFDASVYPGLMVARALEPHTTSGASHQAISTTVVHGAEPPVACEIAHEHLSLDDSPGAPWLLLPGDVRHAFDRMRSAGIPLAESPIGRAHLGVKCGLNDAFLVRCIATSDGEAQIVAADGRTGWIERSLVRPVARGENVTPWVVAEGDEAILWTHDATGAPLATLPPLAARWFARWRRALAARTDARAQSKWWTLFRTEAARSSRARVIWADVGRTPRAAVIRPHHPVVPVNSCYVAHCRDEDDAYALAALLNSSLAAAWLEVLAEPARGGYRRFLGWTMSLFPLPVDWTAARVELARVGRAASADPTNVQPTDLLDAALAAYGLTCREVAPLMKWPRP